MSVQVTDMTSGNTVPPADAAQLARFLEYAITGWLIRTKRAGTWSVMAVASK